MDPPPSRASPELLRRHLTQKADQLHKGRPRTLLDVMTPEGQETMQESQLPVLKGLSSKRSRMSSEASRPEKSTKRQRVPALLSRLQDRSSLSHSGTSNYEAITKPSKSLIERLGDDCIMETDHRDTSLERPAPQATSLSTPAVNDPLTIRDMGRLCQTKTMTEETEQMNVKGKNKAETTLTDRLISSSGMRSMESRKEVTNPRIPVIQRETIRLAPVTQTTARESGTTKNPSSVPKWPGINEDKRNVSTSTLNA
ncbi:hypothetical protein H0H92_008616, partial [Tricholoma furcatifolium]